MTIRYVQTNDNKYVQYMLNAQSFTVEIDSWEKINLEREIDNLNKDINGDIKEYDSSILVDGGYIDSSDGEIKPNNYRKHTDYIAITPGSNLKFTVYGTMDPAHQGYALYNEDKTQVVDGGSVNNDAVNEIELTTPSNARWIRISFAKASSLLSKFYVRETISLGIRGDIAELQQDMQIAQGNITELQQDIQDIQQKEQDDIVDVKTNIGAEAQTEVLTDDDFCGFSYNGTKYMPATSQYNGIYLPILAGQRISFFGNRASFYFTKNEPVINGNMEGGSYQAYVLDYTAQNNGYLFFNIVISNFENINYNLTGVGIKNDISLLQNAEQSSSYYNKMTEHFLGNRRLKENAKNPFSWNALSKGVLTIRMDDLNASVDLAAKIVTEEYSYPLVLAAPVRNAMSPVSGITNPEDKLGETRLDICRYVVANGGEVMEHSSNTFSSDDYFNANGIKPIFIDQKVKWEEYGILVRGSAVANSTPSDSLKDVLAPYLWYYYDYSDGYGKVEPYVRPQSWGHMGIDNATFEQICSYIDDVVSNNKWGEIIFHHVNYNSGDYQLTDTLLRQIMTYIQTNVSNDVLEVKTYAQVYDDN